MSIPRPIFPGQAGLAVAGQAIVPNLNNKQLRAQSAFQRSVNLLHSADDVAGYREDRRTWRKVNDRRNSIRSESPKSSLSISLPPPGVRPASESDALHPKHLVIVDALAKRALAAHRASSPLNPHDPKSR